MRADQFFCSFEMQPNDSILVLFGVQIGSNEHPTAELAPDDSHFLSLFFAPVLRSPEIKRIGF